MSIIPYTKPSITSLEINYASDAVAFGWGENCYEYIKKFEGNFSSYLGSKYSIATSSCTGAIFLALSSINLQPDDEVIVADINWIATISPIVKLGCKPVFVDIDPVSWCIDPEKVESAITKKTKAIIATHIYGNVCEMSALKKIADNYNLYLIEDAAEAIGSKYYGQIAGSIGDIGVFSFHGTKTLTTGEGGMFVTNDDYLYDKALTLSNHGRNSEETKQFWPQELGFKFKISNVQAAIGCAQLERIDELISRKREIFHLYNNKLKNYSSLKMNVEQENCLNGYWMPTVIFAEETGIKREKILKAFCEQKIDARVFFWPVSNFPMFDSASENKHAYSISERGINLPSFHDISDKQVGLVLDIILKLLDEKQ